MAIRFGLPYSGEMQDWEWEVANPSQFEEYLEAYASAGLPQEQLFSLMEMLIQYVEFSGSESSFEFSWEKIKLLLERNKQLHRSTINYWSCLNGSAPEELFQVTLSMRGLQR